MNRIKVTTIPTKSGYHFTSLGWVFFDAELREYVKDECIVNIDRYKPMKDDQPCFRFDKMDKSTTANALTKFKKDEMVAIYSESSCDIIGYVNADNAERIGVILNNL